MGEDGAATHWGVCPRRESRLILHPFFHAMQSVLRQSIMPFLFYCIMMVLVIPQHLATWIQLSFVAYAVFIFWMVWDTIVVKEGDSATSTDNPKFFYYLLGGAVIFLIATRLYIFLRYGWAPLGYDTGFYIDAINATTSSFSKNNITSSSLGISLGSARAIRTYLWIPLLWLGVPSLSILNGFYLLFQALLAGSVYMLARSFHYSSRLVYGAVAVFLFAGSLPQFFAFWWMFYQMELAISLLLITIVLLQRRSVLAVLTGGFGAALHPATFLPFGVALVLFSMLQIARSLFGWKKLEKETLFILVVGLAVFVFVTQFGQEFIRAYTDGSVGDYGWFLTNFPIHLQTMFTGLYIDISLFQLANLYIIPFSAIGVLLFLFGKLYKGKSSRLASALFLVFVFLIVLLVVSYFPFIYHHRFLIILDLMLMVFATQAFAVLVVRLLQDRQGKISLGLLLFGLFLFSGYSVWNQKPQLYQDELSEIRAIDTIAAPSDYVMTTESIYTPWVKAFSHRETLDPGFLTSNKWSYEMWKEFWEGNNNTRRHELLQMYHRPIYIFVGNIVPANVPYMRFIASDRNFFHVSPHLWKYDPNLTQIRATVD